MSSYAEKNLISGESIVLKAKINFLAIIRQIIWAVIMIVVAVVLGSNEALNAEGVEPIKTIVVAVCLVIGLMPLLIGILGLVCTSFAVTNKRVIGKTGVLKIETLDLHIDKVDTVTIKAPFWGRILRYYYVEVRGSGSSKPVTFKYISNAPQLKNSITEAIEQHAAEARKAQAAEIALAMNRGRM